MNAKGLAIFAITAMVVFAAFTGVAGAKSLYVIADINANPTPIQAYDIQGNTLVYQATYNVPYHGGGAVGLTIDTDSETLFVTYEFSNIIEKIDAKTMTSVGSTTVAGASNLAGIVVDQDKGLVYAVDRTTHNLYIYNLSLVYQSTIVLPTGSGSYGIALDEINDLLYVADRTTTVRYYDTTNWLEQGSFTVSHTAVGIAVDTPRQMVYTVAGFAASNLLSKYDLGGTESTVSMGHGGMGAAVDGSTGLVYVSGGYSGDDVSVWNPGTMCQTNSTGGIGNPTGLCVPGEEVGYNPLNLSKSDDVADDDCVYVGDTITYTICYDNQLNNYDVHNVVIVDTLPANVSFVSATGGGVYNPGPHTVKWTIGTVTAGASEVCITLTVRVNAGAESTTLTNCCTIGCDEIGPASVCVDTDVCEAPPEPEPLLPPSVPTMTPIGIASLVGLLGLIGAGMVMRRR